MGFNFSCVNRHCLGVYTFARNFSIHLKNIDFGWPVIFASEPPRRPSCGARWVFTADGEISVGEILAVKGVYNAYAIGNHYGQFAGV